MKAGRTNEQKIHLPPRSRFHTGNPGITQAPLSSRQERKPERMQAIPPKQHARLDGPKSGQVGGLDDGSIQSAASVRGVAV